MPITNAEFMIQCTSSVFCWIGMFPLFFYFIYAWYKQNKEKGLEKKEASLLKSLKWELSAASFLILIVLLFYYSKQYPETLTLNKSLFLENGLLYYFVFLLLELLPVLIILILCSFEKIAVPGIVWISLGVLFLLPLFQLGLINDLVMRGSIPALMIVMMFCASIIQATVLEKPIKRKCFIFLFFVMVVPIFVNEYIWGLISDSDLLEFTIRSAKQYAGGGSVLSTIMTKMF